LFNVLLFCVEDQAKESVAKIIDNSIIEFSKINKQRLKDLIVNIDSLDIAPIEDTVKN